MSELAYFQAFEHGCPDFVDVILYIIRDWSERLDFTGPPITANQGETLEKPEMTLAERN